MTDDTKVVQETVEEAPTPVHYQVSVTNTLNGTPSDIFSRDFPFGKKDSAMKGVRQRIRDLSEGASIRNAKVTFEDQELSWGLTRCQTIAFTDLVITEKPKTTATRGTSNARKNAADPVITETDQEILGIANDTDLQEEDARQALLGYKRHLLIHAVNVGRDEDNKLSHYSTQLAAVACLLESQSEKPE